MSGPGKNGPGKNGKSGKTGNGTGPSRPSGGGEGGGVAPFYRIAEIYERAWREDRPDDTIRLTWDGARRPAPFVPPATLAHDLGPHWPARIAPTRTLRPRRGHAAPLTGPIRGALFVTLFGLTGDRVRDAVARIERQLRPAQSLAPVFLTDQPETSIFRHAGFTVEQFPADIFGDPAQAPAFARRFEDLWRKWNGMLLIDFSASGYLAARLENLETYLNRASVDENRFDPRVARPPPRPAPVTDVVSLKAEYRAAGLDEVSDTFVLYRVLGNDLPPRHEVGQTLANLRFMLDHEPALEGCEKRWIVNRIVEPEQEAAIIALLEERDQPYLRIPFDLGEYGRIGWDLQSFPDDAFFLRGRYGQMAPYDQSRAQAHVRRFKNNYVINNNGARNAALRDGKTRAKWVLPWDGNCFLTERAWSEIATAVREKPYLKYFTVPMVRATDNADLLNPDYYAEADSEPQMLFRADSAEEFDEAHYYGRRPKVELFYRLGIPGTWDRFYDDVWDLPRPELSEDAGSVGEAGWVARLFSGQKTLETEAGSALRSRGEARIAAITGMLDRLDVKATEFHYRAEALTCYDEEAVARLADAPEGTPERQLRDRLIHEADLALQRGPFSVIHKSDVAPSGNRHDYYHPAPYWWPNPMTPDGHPFVFRDGERVPGTRLYEPQSDRFDRTRLQLMFDDTTALALAWALTARDDYAGHAAGLIRTWFLDPATRMTPHLTYAQVRGRWPGDTGAKSGLIEMKDLYYLLDAVRIVERSGGLSDDEKAAFRTWLREYLEWLQTSEQGTAERLTKNNHGTCYDLQTASIAAFLGDAQLLERTFLTSRERVLEQFTADGEQPHEMARTQTAHYCCFNLQAWVNLATLAEACGHDLWSFEGADGRGLARAFSWLMDHMMAEEWPYRQIEPFDRDRFLPLYVTARDVAAPRRGAAAGYIAPATCDPLFFPHDGIKPFWMLGRPPCPRGISDTWRDVANRLGEVSQSLRDRRDAALQVDAARDPAELEARLWGGFSRDALHALHQQHEAADTPPDRKTALAWSLAKWAFRQGDFGAVLTYLDDLAPGPATRRDHAILRASCLLRTGQADAAERILRDHLERYPDDPDFLLLLANLARAQPGAEDDWTAWLNRIYHKGGLDGLLGGADGSVGWRAPRDAGAGPGYGDGDGGGGADDTRVSIILTPPPGAPCAEMTLASALSQRWANLEILMVDRSGVDAVASDVAARSKADPRLVVLPLDAETPDHEARNLALAKATGSHVTRLDDGESAHPMRTALQMEERARLGVPATRAMCVRMASDGEALLAWTERPGLLQDNPASIMVETQLLRSVGGWDAVESDADDLLAWRLARSGILPDIPVVCAGVPLSLSIVDPDTTSLTPARWRHGVSRDARIMTRHRIAMRAAQPDAAVNLDPGALPQTFLPSRQPLDTVYVGDFAADAPGLDHMLARIEAEANGPASVGVFHWPDYAVGWATGSAPGPAEAVLELIDAGRISWVHAHQKLRAQRVVLCQTHMIAHPVDGLPAFGAERVDVLAGPQMRPPVPASPAARSLPDQHVIEELFSAPVRWIAV